MTQYLLFVAGGLELAAPSDLVEAVHDQLGVQAVAGTCGWFRGLAVAHGKLLPVTDLGAFATKRSSSGRTLELNPAVGMVGLQVDSIVGLSHAEVSEVPLSNAEQSQQETGLRLSERAIVHGSSLHRVLDLASLVQSPEFLTIADNA